MKQRRPSLMQDQQGFAFVLFAIGFTALILSAVLAINFTGIGHSLGPQQQQADMQMVADAAARAAAIEAIKYQNAPDPETQRERVQAAAEAIAAVKNYGSEVGASVIAHIGSQITEGNYKNIPYAVEVIITKPWNFIFLPPYVSGKNVVLTARAVAAWYSAPAFVALNRTSSNPTGITISGNSQISVIGGVYSNNPDPSSSIQINGASTEFCASAFASAGSFSTSGLCNSLSSGGTPVTQTEQPFIDDPYAPPAYDYTPVGENISLKNNFPTAQNWNEVTNFVPGIYSDKITFTSGTHTFASGKYYFRSSLNMTGGTIDATAAGGVTFVFQEGSGGFNVTGSSPDIKFSINAPPIDSTPYGGLAIVSLDRSKQGFTADKMTANVNGIIYAPNAEISYNATKSDSNSEVCLNIWALAIRIGGGASIGQTCPATNVNAGAFLPAGLVE